MTTSTTDPRTSTPAGATADTRKRPRRPIALAAAGTATVAIVAGAGYIATPPATPTSSGAGVVPSTRITVPQTEVADSTASARLVAVADLISTMSVHEEPSTYIYLETEHWSRRDGTEIIGFHEKSWRASDGFTRTIERRLPAQPAAGFDLNQIGHTAFDTAPPVISEYSAGEVQSFTERHHAPPSHNPEQLTRQLDAESLGPNPPPCPPACGRQTPPPVFLDNVIGLHRTEFLDLGTRVAVLRIVATLPDLAGGTPVTDRAGRTGIAVWLDHQGVRQTLIFDPNTGHLLATERSVPGFVLDDYTLYLDSGYRDTLDRF